MQKEIVVSVITPVLNGEETLESTIKSVLAQSYKNIEYIIVDNGSTDGTPEVVDRYRERVARVLSEKERGIYTTINRGLKSAAGDIVGVLNSDDLYADKDVIKDVVEKMAEGETDACWGDLVYVNREKSDKIIRYWKSSEFEPNKFKTGWMPPHPTVFLKREIYARHGFLNTAFKISADYEFILRVFYKHKIPVSYLPRILVKMRWGGLSNRNIGNVIKKTVEDYRACRIHGLGVSTVFIKNIIKIPQFFVRQK